MQDCFFIIVIYYQCLFNYIEFDFVYVFYKGCIVKLGDKLFVLELEDKGYDWIKEEVDVVVV